METLQKSTTLVRHLHLSARQRRIPPTWRISEVQGSTLTFDMSAPPGTLNAAQHFKVVARFLFSGFRHTVKQASQCDFISYKISKAILFPVF
jgi:hypothetical protein